MSGIIAQNVGRHTGLVKAASAGGAWTLISTQTVSSDSTISFTSGLDNTYDEYCFKFINIHPETTVGGSYFTFNGSSDSGSNYNVTKTSTWFFAYNSEAGSEAALSYNTSYDLAQGTGFQNLAIQISGDNEDCFSGYLHLFNPSSTTFVKHWISRISNVNEDPFAQDEFSAGYFNTTSAIDAIQFKMASNNIDAGTISLFGIG